LIRATTIYQELIKTSLLDAFVSSIIQCGLDNGNDMCFKSNLLFEVNS